VRSIRWFDADRDTPSVPVDWRMASLVLAALFFNFLFAESHSTSLGLWLPLPLYAVFMATVAAILTALFFMGPALACQSRKRPILRVIQDSVGTVPAFALRVCFVLFLVFWITAMIALPVYWWSALFRQGRASAFESGAVAATVLTFLFITAHQTMHARSALSLFTNKVALVILFAALIHVREGWGATLVGSRWDGWYYSVWMGLSELASYMAPLGLVAANFGYRVGGRRQVALMVACGAALPLLVTMLLVGLIRTATYHSSFYQPSLNPTVSMALWSHTARSALGGRLLVAAVTVFGALRFAGRSMTDIVGVRFPGSLRGWLFVSCVIAVISWLALHPFADALQVALDWSGRCLGVASAIITADLLTRKQRDEEPQIVNWIGLTAVLAGLATPLYISHGPVMLTPMPWWYPWLLPSYIVAFFVGSIGRLMQRSGILPQIGSRSRPLSCSQ